MTDDKRTIGVTPRNAASLARLAEAGNFASELDAAKFAMAYAISCGVAIGISEGAETKWNVGSVDPDGSMRALLEALYPDTEGAYRTMEFMLNQGLELLAPSVMGQIDVVALIGQARARQ
jgi:hypothetical protein